MKYKITDIDFQVLREDVLHLLPTGESALPSGFEKEAKIEELINKVKNNLRTNNDGMVIDIENANLLTREALVQALSEEIIMKTGYLIWGFKCDPIKE